MMTQADEQYRKEYLNNIQLQIKDAEYNFGRAVIAEDTTTQKFWKEKHDNLLSILRELKPVTVTSIFDGVF